MSPQELKSHKEHTKRLASLPVFTPLAKKKNGLPKPLDMLGRRKEVFGSGLMKVSDTHIAFFLYRDGEILTDRAFYGYLFCELKNASLYTLYEFHWHPSHKGIHCKLPCNTDNNYAGRLLVQAPELQIQSSSSLDPANEQDRLELVRMFCEKCGVSVDFPAETKATSTDNQGDLFHEQHHG